MNHHNELIHCTARIMFLWVGGLTYSIQHAELLNLSLHLTWLPVVADFDPGNWCRWTFDTATLKQYITLSTRFLLIILTKLYYLGIKIHLIHIYINIDKNTKKGIAVVWTYGLLKNSHSSLYSQFLAMRSEAGWSPSLVHGQLLAELQNLSAASRHVLRDRDVCVEHSAFWLLASSLSYP